MNAMKRIFPLRCLLASSVLAAAAAAEPQEVQAPEPELAPLANLVWRLPAKYATLEGDRLVVDIPADAYPADAMVTAQVPAALLEGAEGFAMAVSAKGSALAKPTQSWLGLKFQLHWRDAETGGEAWPNCRNVVGDLPEATLRNEATFGGARPGFAELQLGLQGTSGRVEFDLSTLRAGPTPGVFRRINQDWTLRYPAAANGGARRRGVMLPGRDPTEEDFATLAEWGATLARYQMVRNWSAVGDNRDLDEFRTWIDGKIDCLETVVLPCARKYGIKVVVDLHVTPGGRTEDREMAMFREKEFADAFVETWRRIATRLKGNADAIYGYDLVNEPNQIGRAPFDYWTLQRRAAEAVREIDPDTAIVVESNDWDSPGAFAYLSPLRMDNVIYQVHCYRPMEFTHQGVGGRPVGAVWPDPSKGWDRDLIRRTMEPVREFQKRHGAKIYVGEFSASTWAPGSDAYLRDCIAVFEEFGWDWSYHAFREWGGWSVEHASEAPGRPFVPSADNPRKRALLDGFRGAAAPAGSSGAFTSSNDVPSSIR